MDRVKGRVNKLNGALPTIHCLGKYALYVPSALLAVNHAAHQAKVELEQILPFTQAENAFRVSRVSGLSKISTVYPKSVSSFWMGASLSGESEKSVRVEYFGIFLVIV